eukprot:jgi/Botrbrau1/3981/Bobra.0365s0053.1
MASAEALVPDEASSSSRISISLMYIFRQKKKPGGGEGDQQSGQASSSSHNLETKEAQANTEKLKGYHDLSKDALERAYTRDEAGQYAEAVRLYRMAIQVLYEGLALQVPLSGLGPPTAMLPSGAVT